MIGKQDFMEYFFKPQITRITLIYIDLCLKNYRFYR